MIEAVSALEPGGSDITVHRPAGNVSFPSRCLIYLLTADVAMTGFSVVVSVLVPALSGQFHPDSEFSLATWYASSKLFTAALIVGFVAHSHRYKKIAPILLALILLALSADEAAQIHEKMGRVISAFVTPNGIVIPGTPSPHDWPYVYAPPALLMLFGVMLWIRKNDFFGYHTWRRFGLGFLVLFLGAVGMEIVGQYANWAILVARVEELIENFGSSLLIWASAYAVVDQRVLSEG